MTRVGWYTVKEIREELRFPSDEAVRVWCKRRQIVPRTRGPRVLLFSSTDLDRAIAEDERRRALRLLTRKAS
jgi:hypothetical protein